MMNKKNKIFLELKNVVKVFPGVKAVDNVSLSINSGEIVALLGENGAGKTTLVKILSGALSRNSGEIILDNVALPQRYSTLEARKYGIAMIYQELSLLSKMTVAENIFLTHEPVKIKGSPFLDYKKMYKETKKQLKRLNIDYIDVKKKIDNLPMPEKQMIEILKALVFDCRILVMDEPTTALTWEETNRFFNVIRSLKEHGVTVIYISHRLDEIFEIADRVAIMRDGKLVENKPIASISKKEIISLMTGKQLKHYERATKSKFDVNERKNVLLRVEDLTDNKMIKNVSFCVYENEVLGIGGLIGSKRTEMVRMIFGADKIGGGNIYLSEKKLYVKNPNQAIKIGIGYLSENRLEEGLNLGLTVKENIVQADTKSVSKCTFILWEKVREICENFIKKLNIKAKNDNLLITLSGGNQQKVAVSKWLHARCRLLIFDEPTKGLDVAAKQEIYNLVKSFATKGKAAIVVSSEVNELVDVSDRVIVMSKGQLTSELLASEITQNNLLHAITKGRNIG